MNLPNPNELKYFFYITTKSHIAQKIPFHTLFLLVLMTAVAGVLLIMSGCHNSNAADQKSLDYCLQTHDNFVQLNQQMEVMHRASR